MIVVQTPQPIVYILSVNHHANNNQPTETKNIKTIVIAIILHISYKGLQQGTFLIKFSKNFKYGLTFYVFLIFLFIILKKVIIRNSVVTMATVKRDKYPI